MHEDESSDADQDTIAFGYGPAGYDQGGYGEDGYLPTGYGRYGRAGWGQDVPPPPRRPRRGGHALLYLVVGVLAAGAGAGLTAAFGSPEAISSTGVSASEVPRPHGNPAGSGSSSSPFNQAAVEAKVEPGLVDITSTLKYAGESAEGTGMILSPSGLVLTNNHVIDGATSVAVTLVGSRARYQAQVVGYDNTDDVALLRLSGASGLTAVTIGNSSQVSLGIPVLALGNAGGKGGVTPTRGVIDALNRSIQAGDGGSGTTEDLNHMLQTTAEIQQGDSGGALVNKAGQVIGMITAAGQSGRIGFAIPIDSALAIARLIAAGKASPTVYLGTPGFLGVVVAQSNSPDPRRQAFDAQESGRGGRGGHGVRGGNAPACLAAGQVAAVPAGIAPAGTGALVLGVLCGTAAPAEGLAPGDVITSVDGQAVTTPNSLTDITARYHPGTVVSVAWVSVDGARHTTSVTLGIGPAR
jgi:S1-C subfamily serine protease